MRGRLLLPVILAAGCFSDAPGIELVEGESTGAMEPVPSLDGTSTTSGGGGGSDGDTGLPDPDGSSGDATTESPGSTDTGADSTSTSEDDGAESSESGESSSSSSTGTAMLDEHRVFITATTHGAAMGGLDGADAICSAAADAAELEGIWRAVLSDSTAGIDAHVEVVGPVYTLGGDLVAMDADALFSGTAEHAVDVTEAGGVPADTVAWVGSATAHCNDWSSASGAVNGTQALSTNLEDWLYGSSLGPCSLSRSLYCIDQPSAAGS